MTSPGKELKRLSITRAMEEAPAHACDYCGVMTVHQCSAAHPVATKLGGCPLFSFYCSLGHQLLDSQNHLEKCEKEEDKNKLVDIARTIQDCWLVIRQNTWDHDVKSIRIDESGTKGIVVCELGDGEKFAGGQVFHEFDNGLVEELETKFGNVHDAVLTAGTSEHAVACLYKLIEYLLRDSATQIEEIRVSPSVPLLVVQNLSTPNPSQTQALTEFNHASNHWIYKITTKTGEEYALDITGIQYGNDCVCSRWQEAQLSHRVFGESHTRLQNVANTQFATLEAAFREMNWMLLSTIFDLFVEEVQHKEKKEARPLGRSELVRSLEQILKDIPVDAVSALGDFRDWVGGSCDSPTPLAKMLGRVAPGVVPRGTVVSEEVGVEMDGEDVGDGVGEEVTENMYDRYLRTGKVGCTLL